jgi:hypothetical protein
MNQVIDRLKLNLISFHETSLVLNNIVNIVKALLTGENILSSLLCFYAEIFINLAMFSFLITSIRTLPTTSSQSPISLN